MKICLLVLAMSVLGIGGMPSQRELFKPNLIVGGEDAIHGEFPSIVQVKIGNAGWCGGSIIDENWILTAGHCAVFDLSEYTIIAGEHDLRIEEGTEQRRNATRLIVHPEYRPFVWFNDIGLIKVDKPFTFGQFVTTANLSSSDPTTGKVEVAGWGALRWQGPMASILQKVTVPIVGHAECQRLYQPSTILESMICAGEAGLDSCQNDSGGPLMSGNTVSGIVSWGDECAKPGKPGVYTSVASFIPWIKENAV